MEKLKEKDVRDSLRNACQKVAKMHRDAVRFQVMDGGEFLLSMLGDSEIVPRIGWVDGDLIGSLDDINEFAALIGYEMQIEKVLFDPEKMKYVCGAGWSGKIWRKDSMVVGGDPVVESLEAMFPSQIAAATLLFIACVKGASWQHTKDVVKSVFRRR